MSHKTNRRYQTLSRIVDGFCKTAPHNLAGRYRPDPSKYPEEAKHAMTRAYCHLFLLVRFGLIDFHEREAVITDGKQDGGLDAYYIDHPNRKVYLIQSKFHHTAHNFESDFVGANDLMKTEFPFILRGEVRDSLNIPFNHEVRAFQKALSKTASYEPIVILLANVNLQKARLKKLIGNFRMEIYDAEKVYSDLVFRFCAGDFSTPGTILMKIRKAGKKYIALEQDINIKSGLCGINIVFAPTSEVGRVVSKYKNSILRFNPRNYLSLSHNSVNKRIEESIISVRTNEFSILNNGITILADAASIEPNTGNSKIAHLKLDALTQIKRHRGGFWLRGRKGSLTHGKRTPEKAGADEHESRNQRRPVASIKGSLRQARTRRPQPHA